MPRIRAEKKQVKSFQRGFITEATGLSFPNGAAKDLDNVDLELRGAARRRLGFDEELGGVLIGEGELVDQTILGERGGPLSVAGGIEAAAQRTSWSGASLLSDDYLGTDTDAFTFSYRDSDVTPNVPTAGDVQVAVGDPDFGNRWPVTFDCEAQDSRWGMLNTDVNFETFNYWSFTLDIYAGGTNSNPKSSVGVMLGTDVNGQGYRLEFSNPGNGNRCRLVQYSSFDSATPSDPTDLLAGDFIPGRGEYHRAIITATKVDTSEYSIFVTIFDEETEAVTFVGSSSANIATFGDYFGLSWGADNKDPSRMAFRNIQVAAANYTSGGGADEEVTDEELAITVHKWPSPNGEDGVELYVTQIGNRLHFRDADGNPISTTGGDVPSGSDSLDIDNSGSGFVYNTTAAVAAKTRLQSAVGLGRIWFTSPAVVPFYAELDRTDKASPQIVLRPNGYESPFATPQSVGARVIRDFNGVPDNLDVDENPAAITAEHAYNLLNQGWNTDDNIDTYQSSQSVYPSNAQQWFLGKDASNNFDPTKLDAVDTGTTQAPRGRFTLDALVGDKDGRAHTIDGLTNPIDFDDRYDEESQTGWATVAFFEGRVFYAGDQNRKRPNGVYFSRVIKSPRDSGYFHQEADPTSEAISDLVATDGGVIYITEADRIRKLVPFGKGVLVMAMNGIWYVYGGETNFTATSFAVEKLTSTGILSAESVVNADDQVVFWAENSIHRVIFGNGRLPFVQDIAESTILSHYTQINRAARDVAWGVYDHIAKRVMWQYKDGYDGTTNPSLFDRALILDTRARKDEAGNDVLAFTKYSHYVETGDEFYGIGPAFSLQTDATAYNLEVVTENDGVTIVFENDGTTPVTAYEETTIQGNVINHLRFLFLDARDGFDGLRIMSLLSTTFQDYTSLGLEQDYTSYIEAYDEHLDDLKRDKQVTYLHSYFRRTESGFDGDLEPTNPSGCTVQARWEWHNSTNGNRWGNQQRAYRYRRPYVPVDSDDNYDNGESILHTKLKIRGHGRAVSFYFESVTGKDFQLLGYQTDFTANAER